MGYSTVLYQLQAVFPLACPLDPVGLILRMPLLLTQSKIITYPSACGNPYQWILLLYCCIWVVLGMTNQKGPDSSSTKQKDHREVPTTRQTPSHSKTQRNNKNIHILINHHISNQFVLYLYCWRCSCRMFGLSNNFFFISSRLYNRNVLL